MFIQQVSLQGKRPSNEDQHIIIENLNGKNNSINNINLLGIFDGHGGPGVSKFMKDSVSKYFVNKKIGKLLKSNKYFEKYTLKVFDTMQTKLIKNHPIIAKKSGSTALIALQELQGDHLSLQLINLGDCRAVLCNKYNIAHQLTKDHKPNSLEERKRIHSLGGDIKWDGFDWRVGDLSLSRAMGDGDNCPFVTHRPEIFRYRIYPQDKFLIMACDGLWDVLGNQEVVDFVNEYLNQGVNPNKVNLAKALADFAIRSGSTDNVTVLIQFIQPYNNLTVKKTFK
jgi:serine/threonine protein phosphatase PrpC